METFKLRLEKSFFKNEFLMNLIDASNFFIDIIPKVNQKFLSFKVPIAIQFIQEGCA